MKLARTLRTPSAQAYASAYLLGGTSATTVVATWNAVTDGAFQITIDGVAISVTGIDFTTPTTMALVAATIQTALRLATGGSEVVLFDTAFSRFVIISGKITSSSAISKLTAGASGTDISGAGATAFMDADAGASNEVVVDAALGYQTLTGSFATLGEQFTIAHAGQMSLKMVHKAQATTNSPTVTYYMETSDDPIKTAETDSVWHPIGGQDSVGGSPSVLTNEDYQVTSAAATGTSDIPQVPLRYTDTAQKARVRIKSNVVSGRAKASFGIVEH